MPAAQAAALNVKNYGAKGDGRTDDTVAIQAALKDAKGRADPIVYFPAGVYRYSKVPIVDSVHVQGAGPSSTIFEFTNNNRSSWRLTGDSPEIQNVSIRAASAPTRRSTIAETAGLDVTEARHFMIDKVNISGPASAGILVRNSGGNSTSSARITGCVVTKTLADGIHMTGGSSYITVDGNRVTNTGDDFIAVVSYRDNGVFTHNIKISNNVVNDQSWGRGITVVGGSDVVIDRNTIRRASGAGVFITSDEYYDTFGVFRVDVTNNVVSECGSSDGSGHAGIMTSGRLSPRGQDNRVCNITVADNTVTDSKKAGIWADKYSAAISMLRNTVQRSRTSGIGMGPNAVKVTLAGNRVDGAGSNGISVLQNCDRVSLLNDSNLGGSNTINNCNDYGIEVRGEGSTGALKIVGTQISDINRRSYSRRQAIQINGSSTRYAITVTDNRLHYGLGDRFEKMILSEFPMTHRRNATIFDGGLPFFID